MKDKNRYKNIAYLADHISKLQRQLTVIRGLLTTKSFDLGSKLVLKYDDGLDKAVHYMMYFDGLDVLVEEEMELAIPFLGAAETSIREQIRKLEEQLRELGVK